MRRSVRSVLVAVAIAGLVPAVATRAQQAPAPKAQAPKPSPAAKAKLDQVLATVNGDPVTRGQFLQFINQYQINPGSEATAYTTALDILINTKLLTQYLDEKKVVVANDQIEKIVAQQRKAASENNSSLESMLADSNMTLDQMRDTVRASEQWRTYIEQTAKDPQLEAYAQANPDVFNGAQVKASHIQINLDEDATDAAKQAAKDKLVAIKKEIASGAITFADAANKYSEDPTNKEQPSGGDLRWFPRKRFTEPFAKAAFALPVGGVSDPVETEYGMHLIQVTDRKDGNLPPLAQNRERVLNQFAVDEQNRIVTDMRKAAKIDIKPMPTDLFAPAPAPASAPAATEAVPKAKAGTPKS